MDDGQGNYMILKLIQNVIMGRKEDVVREMKPSGKKKAGIDPIDIVRESMKSGAEGLRGLVATGQTGMDRIKMKDKVRAKVKKNLIAEFDDEEITEEVTERILDAAEFDPYYRGMFED